MDVIRSQGVRSFIGGHLYLLRKDVKKNHFKRALHSVKHIIHGDHL